MPHSLRSLLALSLSLAACADDPDSAPPADEFTAPATADEVAGIYDQLGTCNDSFVTRMLTPRATISPATFWSTPATAPAGLMSWRTPTGWNQLLLANELTFGGIAEEVKNPDPACEAVQQLLTPVRDPATGREQFTHALLYLDEVAHPYTRYPEAGIEVITVDAPAALTSYLAVVYAKREVDASGTTIFSDMVEQHLPMYVTCSKPLAIETTTVMLDDLGGVDRALCDAGTDVDGDGDLDHRCVAERGKHVAGNTCTFVVDASKLELADGRRQSAIFGGTLTARGEGDAVSYALTVDRFSR